MVLNNSEIKAYVPGQYSNKKGNKKINCQATFKGLNINENFKAEKKNKNELLRHKNNGRSKFQGKKLEVVGIEKTLAISRIT